MQLNPGNIIIHIEKEVRKILGSKAGIFNGTFLVKKRYGGFTLVELLAVIAIIGTLSGIAIPAYNHYIDMARIARAKIEINILQKEIEEFNTENGFFPSSLNDIGRDYLLDPWGNPYEYLNFATLDDKGGGKGGGTGGDTGGSPGDGKNEDNDKGKPRKDRFLHPLNTYYDLYSMGKDGKSRVPLTAQASHDDIIRANDGKFIGLASEY